MLEAAAALELRVEHISREDCRELEGLLSTWATLRKDRPAQVDGFHAQLMHGSLRLDVARLINDGILTWQDTLHPAKPRSTDAAELVEEPLYERGTGELLAPALVDTTLLLPGGAAAARRRQLAQASVGDWVDGGAYEAPACTSQPKRRRVGMNKCHNCGSYKHSMSKCPVPFDQKRVNAAMAEVRAERGSAPAMLRLRYFDVPGSKGGEPDRAGLPPPGTISNDLAQALGMTSSTAPPPWLSRMVVLGVPPRYAEQNEVGEEAQAAAAEELMVFYTGSDDEAEAANADFNTAAAAEAIRDPGDGAAAGGSSSSSSSDDEDEGFIPFKAAAAASVAEQAMQQAGGSQGVHEASVTVEQQQQGEQAQHLLPEGQEGVQTASQQHPPANGVSAVAAGAKQPKWVFPGVNADVPSDSDAWTQAMQNAAWLQGRLA